MKRCYRCNRIVFSGSRTAFLCKGCQEKQEVERKIAIEETRRRAEEKARKLRDAEREREKKNEEFAEKLRHAQEKQAEKQKFFLMRQSQIRDRYIRCPKCNNPTPGSEESCRRCFYNIWRHLASGEDVVVIPQTSFDHEQVNDFIGYFT